MVDQLRKWICKCINDLDVGDLTKISFESDIYLRENDVSILFLVKVFIILNREAKGWEIL